MVEQAIEEGKVRRLSREEVALLPYEPPRAWWYERPPAHIGEGPEWEWYCWRSRAQREERRARVEAAKDKPPQSGATAGWRRGSG